LQGHLGKWYLEGLISSEGSQLEGAVGNSRDGSMGVRGRMGSGKIGIFRMVSWEVVCFGR